LTRRAEPRSTGRREGLTLLALYGLPLFLAVLLGGELRGFPFQQYQLSDGAYYLRWAADLANGTGFGPQPYFVNPLYLYFLALMAKLSLSGTEAIRVLQMLLGALVYPLVYLLGKRCFDRTTGLIAWGLALGYGPLLLAPQEIASTWLEALFAVLVPLVLAGSLSTGRLAAAGLLCGAAVLNRPNLLPFLLCVPFLIRSWSTGPLPVTIPPVPVSVPPLALVVRRAAVFLVVAALVILPVTVRNFVAGNDLVLVTSHGGINFFIGNSPGARGTFYAPPGFHEDPISINSRDARRLASEEAGTPLTPSQASRHWFHRGISWIAGNPGDAASLYLKKLLLFSHAYEVPLNTTYALFREQAPLLVFLIVPFPLLLIAAVPTLLAPATRRDLLPISLLLLVQAAGVLLFFVSSRYRLPLVPLLAVPAAATLRRIAGRLSRKTTAGLAGGTLLALAVGALCVPTPLTRDIDLDSRASSFESLGIYLFDAGRLGEAEVELRSAIALRPRIHAPHWYLARILDRRGDYAGAAGYWRRAAELYGPDTTWGAEAARKAGRPSNQTPSPP